MKKVLYLFCALSMIFTTAKGKKKKPNIIVFLIDDAGYADFSFNGCEEWSTPNIDQLANDGVIFTDAHVTATVCSPSRAGLLTGRYQQRFGHECNSPKKGLGMDVSEVTIADALKSAGYKTVCIGKWHVGNGEIYHPNNRGFDEFYGFIEGHRSYFYEPERDDKEGSSKALMHNNTRVSFEGYLTDVFSDKTIEFIDKFKNDPFFIYYSPNAVHGPMHAKKEHLEKFKDSPRPILAAMTYSLDENIGKIITKLKEEGMYENTLMFFLSDNGGVWRHRDSADNTPLKGEKGNKFEGGKRVPFTMTWTGVVSGGKKYDGLTSALDIFATSIAAAGMEHTTGKPLDGVDLVPYVQGVKDGAPHEYLFWRKDREAAVRTSSLKLLRVEGYGTVLYNLNDDIGETNNLAEKDSLSVKELTYSLESWEEGLVEPLWREGEWEIVNYEIHRALIENEQPKYRSPGARKRYLKSKSE